MIDAEKSAMLRLVLDETCEHLDIYHNATRAHVAAKLLAAAGQDCTIENIRKAGRDALRTAPPR